MSWDVVRCGTLVAVALLGLNPHRAAAADIEGAWTLNYPFDDMAWVFAQGSTDRFAGESRTYTFVDFPARSLMSGRTTGPRITGVTYLTYLGVVLPTGLVSGRVVGNQMDGVVLDYVWGVYQLEGRRSLFPAAN